jgi:hypothetical protein
MRNLVSSRAGVRCGTPHEGETWLGRSFLELVVSQVYSRCSFGGNWVVGWAELRLREGGDSRCVNSTWMRRRSSSWGSWDARSRSLPRIAKVSVVWKMDKVCVEWRFRVEVSGHGDGSGACQDVGAKNRSSAGMISGSGADNVGWVWVLNGYDGGDEWMGGWGGREWVVRHGG